MYIPSDLIYHLFSLGGIYRIGRGMRVSKLASRNFPGAFAVQSLVVTTPSTVQGSAAVGSSSGQSIATASSYSMFFLSFPDKTRVFQCGSSGSVPSSATATAGTGGGTG